MGTIMSPIIGFPIRLFSKTNPNFILQKILDQLDSIENLTESVNQPILCPKIKATLDMMNKITLSDIGINLNELSYFKFNQCANIYSCPSFDISIFILPTGKCLPIHDHPSMSVLSKVIHGELYVRSFSPNKKNNNLLKNGIPVSLELDTVKSNKDCSWILSPTEGNYHEFRSQSTCVVFDILLPPYEQPERECTYYDLLENNVDGIIQYNLSPMRSIPRDLPFLVAYHGKSPKSTFRMI